MNCPKEANPETERSCQEEAGNDCSMGKDYPAAVRLHSIVNVFSANEFYASR